MRGHDRRQVIAQPEGNPLNRNNLYRVLARRVLLTAPLLLAGAYIVVSLILAIGRGVRW